MRNRSANHLGGAGWIIGPVQAAVPAEQRRTTRRHLDPHGDTAAGLLWPEHQQLRLTARTGVELTYHEDQAVVLDETAVHTLSSQLPLKLSEPLRVLVRHLLGDLWSLRLCA